ncbi:thiosulfate dehydrogenase [Roseicella aquatilis]|uniref:Transcriptional initiation protein Tat n=1 Tax=Roseicella aquatilis TaxID=2527868 RepID=A0A4R4D452_9PROT|nr:transcriptional initiation protein Tat [Roseicella aquatilis]TCZ52764.1 transcriptional initiation protein Tat [Roseicella aquatilis]
MPMDTVRRNALRGAGLGMMAAGLAGGSAAAAAQASLEPAGARTLHELTEALARLPRRRDFRTVPMILEKPGEWDDAALRAVLDYRGGPKQAWDNTDIKGPWLNGMRNALNAEIWSFRHPDFLCVSATHGTAQLALYDDAAWEKYQLGRLAGIEGGNRLLREPQVAGDPKNVQAPDGPFSSKANAIPVLQRRGVVFLACHNAIWELAERLHAGSVNPDGLAVDALAADLTNHVIPGAVVTPGAVAALVELQQAGFAYNR